MTIEKKRQIAGSAMAGAGALNYKADVLAPYGVARIRDLDEAQLDDLIQRLNTMQQGKSTASDALRKARSTVLNLLDTLGIKAKDGNWNQVNNYLMLPQIAGKLLYEMNLDELKNCAKKLRAIIRKREKQEVEAARLRRDN